MAPEERYRGHASDFERAGPGPRRLPRGGLDFLIGDGKLRYGRETVWESYYNARLWPGFFVSIAAMRVNNPALNQDRGPLWIESLRLHLEWGKR